MKVMLANPHGFCAGVVMAIRCVERALEILGPPLYVYHEIVHNKHVVRKFRGQGVVFVDHLADVPSGGCLVYSAHGVSPEVRAEAKSRGLRTIDATCPLVAKVHMEAIRFVRDGYAVILIGHEGHDEVVGTMGEAPDQIHLVQCLEDVERLRLGEHTKVAYITQTTLSVDDTNRIVRQLQRRFPHVVGPAKEDICFATQNRQDAVKDLLPRADVVLVIGSENSSNAMRLVEIAAQSMKPAYLIESVADIDAGWFQGTETVLITAGASAPEEIVEECVALLQSRYGASIEQHTVREERAYFPLPLELRSGELLDAPIRMN